MSLLLIAPSGIEISTKTLGHTSRLMLLIAPSGIEIRLRVVRMWVHSPLLIAPSGIEIMPIKEIIFELQRF